MSNDYERTIILSLRPTHIKQFPSSVSLSLLPSMCLPQSILSLYLPDLDARIGSAFRSYRRFDCCRVLTVSEVGVQSATSSAMSEGWKRTVGGLKYWAMSLD
jgi:hypothetical protein